MIIPVDLPDGSICNCQVIPSRRAKYLRLKISPQGEVSIVLPQGVKLDRAAAYARSQNHWLGKHLDQIRQTPPLPPPKFPEQLLLRMTGEQWTVTCEPETGTGQIRWDEATEDKRLLFSGDLDDQQLSFKALGLWLKGRASRVFPGLLNQLAEQMELPYNRLTIRGQKTRWGSCSSKGNINLNYKLLFFDEAVVRYVMIHELCHTLEMNHSPRFWAHVERFEPNHMQYRNILRQHATDYVPRGL